MPHRKGTTHMLRQTQPTMHQPHTTRRTQPLPTHHSRTATHTHQPMHRDQQAHQVALRCQLDFWIRGDSAEPLILQARKELPLRLTTRRLGIHLLATRRQLHMVVCLSMQPRRRCHPVILRMGTEVQADISPAMTTGLDRIEHTAHINTEQHQVTAVAEEAEARSSPTC
jgi:hypothetical protein